jgi:DinB superfamily
LNATPDAIRDILKFLSGTPGQLTHLIARIDDSHLYTKPGEKTWSAAEILAHLRACSDVWTFSIYAMLTEEIPILPDINERRWAKVTSYARIPLALSLQAFTFQREELLRVLRALPAEGWERAALIFERKHTVFSQARRMALHESEHIEQIRQLKV